MTFLHKNFIIRRKFDQWVLAIGGATLPLRLGIGPVVVFLFSCIGIYLTAFRHKSTKPFVGVFLIAFVLYFFWVFGLIIWRDQLSFSNRQIGYTLLTVLFAFAGPGMVLVRDPLRFYVLGVRVGILVAAIAATIAWMWTGQRVGIGGNQAVFAYLAAATAVAATLPIKNAPRFLGNGVQWLVLGMVTTIFSETRAILVIFPIVLAVEVIAYVRRFNWKKQSAIYALIIAFLAVMSVTGPVNRVIETRFSTMVNYYETGDKSVWGDKRSADIRMAMWSGAIGTIKEHPFTGVGTIDKMKLVEAHAGENKKLLKNFWHVHNIALDELLHNGLIGLILLTVAFVAAFIKLWRTAPDCCTRRVLIYFAAVTLAYGMLHAPLLHETTIATIMLFIGVLYAASVKRIIYKPQLH
ncbi:O-antigen ligase family protein [Brucellaceae bacterium C25G]